MTKEGVGQWGGNGLGAEQWGWNGSTWGSVGSFRGFCSIFGITHVFCGCIHGGRFLNLFFNYIF